MIWDIEADKCIRRLDEAAFHAGILDLGYDTLIKHANAFDLGSSCRRSFLLLAFLGTTTFTAIIQGRKLTGSRTSSWFRVPTRMFCNPIKPRMIMSLPPSLIKVERKP